MRALSFQQWCSTLVAHCNHIGNFNTHTLKPHTQETLTDTGDMGPPQRLRFYSPPWDIARVLGFCCTAEIEKDWGGGREKQEQGLKQRPEEL